MHDAELVAEGALHRRERTFAGAVQTGCGQASSEPDGDSTASADLGAPETESSHGCAPGDLPEVLGDPTTTVLALGDASVSDTPVSVWVVDTASGRRVVAVDAGCRTVVNRLLE